MSLHTGATIIVCVILIGCGWGAFVMAKLAWDDRLNRWMLALLTFSATFSALGTAINYSLRGLEVLLVYALGK